MKQGSAPSATQTKRSPVTLTWKKEDPTEVNLARERFEDHVRAGWLAFKVAPGNRMVQVFEFDPTLETVVLIPFAEGG